MEMGKEKKTERREVNFTQKNRNGMDMKQITHRMLKALANEERKTAKLYRQYGFWRFAKDEAKHAYIFGRMARRKKKNKRR